MITRFQFSPRNTALAFLSGLFVRLLLMPFTVHHDLLCTARRVSLWLYKGVFLLPYWAEVTYAAMIIPFKNSFESLSYILFLDASNYSVIPGDVSYTTFLQSDQVFLNLFLLKLPYLIFDLFLLLIVARHYKNNIYSIVFWALNPFLLYAVYMWGRYEVIPVFFAVLSIFMAEKSTLARQRYLSALCMGLAIGYRLSFLFYLPFLIIYLYKSRKEIIGLLVTAALPHLVFTSIVSLLQGGHSVEKYLNILFSAGVGEGFYDINLFLFVFIITILLSLKDKQNNTLSFRRFISYLSVSILSYFSFSYFYPQYISWITPIAILLVGADRIFLPLFLALFVPFFLLVDASFGCYTSVCLLTEAINPNFAQSFNTIKNQMNELLIDPTLITVLHTVFFSVLFTISYFVKKRVYENKP